FYSSEHRRDRASLSFPTRRSSDLARPLDFGHWAAHKLEQLSQFNLRHGAAVAIGLALDVIYSRRMGYLKGAGAERVLKLLETLGDRKSTRLNSSHEWISYAVFCLK